MYGPKYTTYLAYQSRKTPERIFQGLTDGVASTRWDGQKWIDEGRLPGRVYSAGDIVEDTDGSVWASGGTGKVLHVTVATTGMRDSKAQVISAKDGLPDGANDVQVLGGNVYATALHAQHIFRWDRGAERFVVDDSFLLPIDAPDANTTLIPADPVNSGLIRIRRMFDDWVYLLNKPMAVGKWMRIPIVRCAGFGLATFVPMTMGSCL